MYKNTDFTVKQTILKIIPEIDHAGKYYIWFYVEPFLPFKESFFPSKESSNNPFFHKWFLGY
jgi:hypothetical protein